MKYSVFIPCYNEEQVLKENIKEVLKKLKSLNKSFELVLVDDGSTDNTPRLCDELAEQKRVRCIHYKDPSRRENLIKSFSKAKGEVIAFMDADLSTDLESLPELLDLEGHDLAVGSRYLPESELERKKDRLVISYLFNWLMNFFFRSKVTDHYIGFKAFKKEVIMELLELTGVGVEARKMFWDAEMLAWAQKKGCSIKEVPVKWEEGEKSALGLAKEASMIPYIIKFFFKYHWSKL